LKYNQNEPKGWVLKVTKLYITRHGQTEWNLEGRWQGQKDSKLTTLGENQATWLGDRLYDEKIDVIITSSSPRAIKTAEIIRGDRSIEIEFSDDLREISLGPWEGMLHVEVDELYGDAQHEFWHNPREYRPIKGESFIELIDRVSGEVERIISKHDGKTILMVSHGVTIKALMAYYEDKTLNEFWNGVRMDSTSLSLVEILNDEVSVVMQGNTSHYPLEYKVQSV